jgi:hypothetical protein
MSLEYFLLAFFIVAWAIEFAAFGMQRTVLLISRDAAVQYEAAKPLLPRWFPLVWLPRIAKWGVLLAIALFWSWGVAAGALAADVVLGATLPIPYQVYVIPLLRRLEEVRRQDADAGEYLARMLRHSNFWQRIKEKA